MVRGLQLIRICLLPYARCLVLVATLTGRLLSLHILYFSDSSLVAKAGLEPARLAAPDFESGTSTDSITRPYGGFLEAPQNFSLKRISRACTPLSAASLDNSHFRLGRCHHLTRVFLAPHLGPLSPLGETPTSVFLAHTQPARFSFRTLVIVQIQG